MLPSTGTVNCHVHASTSLDQQFSFQIVESVNDWHLFRCPLYSSEAREEVLDFIYLPTKVQPDHWKIKKVALFLTL